MSYNFCYMFLASYLVGSLSFAIIVSKFMKMNDPRSYGSQNAGATNVMRSGNKKAAVLTLLGDFLKGWLIVLLAQYYSKDSPMSDGIVAISAVLVVIGHILPIFFKFKGGKGVATALGVLLGLNPMLALLFVVTWFIVFKLTKLSGLAAIIAVALSPLYARWMLGNTEYFGAVLFISFIVIYKHKDNIIRMFKGEELGFKKNKNELN